MTGFSWRAIAKDSFFKQSVYLAVLGACNAALAVLMSWYVVAHVGVGADTDAFFASTAIPQFVFILLTATFLPVLVPLLATRDHTQFSRDVWSFFWLTAAIFTLIAVVLYLSADIWVPLFVPGFSAPVKALTVSLARIQLVSMVLNALIVTLWAAHHARHKFAWIELSAILANLAGLLFLGFMLPRLGIWAAAVNTVFYNALKLVSLVPILGRWRWPTWRSQAVKEAAQRLKPLLPGQIYLRTDPVLDRFLTSMTGAGTLSLFHLAQQIYASLVLLLGKAVVAPMVPKLAVDARDSRWGQYRRHYQNRLLLLLAIAFLGCAFVLVGTAFFGLLIGRGVIEERNLQTLWLTLLALSGSLVGGALVQLTAGAFYAMGNTKTPSKISAVVYTLYIPLKIAAFFKFGLIGLAIAVSSYFLTNSVIQLLLLRRDIGRNSPRGSFSRGFTRMQAD